MHNELVSKLNAVIPGADATANIAEKGDSSIFVHSAKIFDVCKTLKEDGFNVLQAITGTDYADRIEVTYILADFTANRELLLKTKLERTPANDNTLANLPKLDTVVPLWKAANFQERETYDMIGVHFVGHPDHRRILTPDDWQGYPLRRDYVVQEKYLDMVVNPPWKNNTEDQMFGKKLKEEIGNPKLVTASWKSDEAEETGDGE